MKGSCDFLIIVIAVEIGVLLRLRIRFDELLLPEFYVDVVGKLFLVDKFEDFVALFRFDSAEFVKSLLLF